MHIVAASTVVILLLLLLSFYLSLGYQIPSLREKAMVGLAKEEDKPLS